MPKCILTGQSQGSSVELSTIAVTTAPTKTSYYSGNTFDPTGLVLTATYTLEGVVVGTKTVTAGAAGLTYSPTILTDGVTAVTIIYTDSGAITSTTTPVSVTHTLSSIAVTTAPTTTTYEYGDSLSLIGMVVTATYTDGATSNVTSSCTFSPIDGTTLTTLGTQAVTASYSDASVAAAKTASTSVTVERKSVAKPTWKESAPTYTGSSINVGSSDYWNNWNTTYFTASGCSGTNAGSYTATFTPNGNYRWSDGTTSSISVGWSIAKKVPSLSVSPTSVAINASNYSSGVAATITYDGDGTLSAVSSNSTVASVTGSGTANLTIKGDGSTAGSATITISAAAGTNYSAASDVTISVTSSYWEWGSNGAAVDANWFAGLQAAVQAGEAQSSWVGQTKYVTLSSAVSGTQGHYIRCIGINQDGANTATFQTVNMLATTVSFGSNATWTNSNPRAVCINYYNAFPGKSYIKTVSKGITNYNGFDASFTYTSETVWIPSLQELGLGSTQYAPSNPEYTYGCSTPYSYYSSNSSRVKYNQYNNAAYWFTRTTYRSASTIFIITQAGAAGNVSKTSGNGVAPAFVIG